MEKRTRVKCPHVYESNEGGPMVELTVEGIEPPPDGIPISMDGDETFLVDPGTPVEFTYPHDGDGTVLVMSTGYHIHVTASQKTIKNYMQRPAHSFSVE